MQKLHNIFSINKGVGGSTLMIDPIDEKIISIRQRIAKFKKDYPELYESENNEREERTYSKTSSELTRTLLSKTQNTTI
tara:strand:+ start:473 stop:709 length:237 start_codon:yes stop_codon:yes gene_type:complete